MIALLLALAADPPAPPALAGLPIGGIGRQALPARGCAAYLFAGEGASRTLVAMAGADPASLRLAIDGTTADYPRAAQTGAASFGFGETTQYRAGEVAVTLDMTVVTRADLTQGAVVREATLRIERPGKDGIVLPVTGLIGCAG